MLLAFIPAVGVGVLAHDSIKTVLFESPRLIALMLILGGVVLLFVDRIAPPVFGRAYGAKMVTTPGEGHVELIAPDSVSWGKQRAEILRVFKL